MKKVILTEQQVEKLMGSIIDEQVPAMRATEYGPSDGRYTKKLRCSFYGGSNLTYNGHKIVNIADEIYGYDYIYINVSYLIDIEHQSYGITDIKIYDVKGPTEIKIPFEYLANDDVELQNAEDEDMEKIEVIIPLNWRKIELNEDYGLDYFGLGDEIEITLINNGLTQFAIKRMEANVLTLKKER